MNLKSTLYVLIYLLLNINLSNAQEYLLQFKKLNHKNGLSDSRVSTVLQSSDGIIWIGNNIAIDRFDGEKTTSYSLGTQVTINTLLEDKNNNIWAGTNQGLYVFDKQKNRFKKPVLEKAFNENIIKKNITSLVLTKDNELLYSTLSREIVKFSLNNEGLLENTIRITNLDKEFLGHITKIAKGTNNLFWLAASDGSIYKLQDNNISFFSTIKKDKNIFINDICEDNSKNLWIATNLQGLFKLNIPSNELNHFTAEDKTNKTINNNNVISLFFLNNNLWIGTDGGGLNLYDTKTGYFNYFTQNASSNSISDNTIISINPGLNDNIFLGTVHGGLSIFKNELSIINIPPKNLGFKKIDQQGSVILEDSNKNIWISDGRSGLLKYDPKTKKSKSYSDNPNNPKDLNGNIVLSLFEDKMNRLWIGTFRGGLNILDLKSDTFIIQNNKPHLNTVSSIKDDINGNIWVGHRRGITIYDKSLNIIKELTPVSDTNPLSNSSKIIFRDIKDDMWIGTINGLYRYEIKENNFKKHEYLHSETDSLSINNDYVLSIGQTKDLSILIGTYGYGLSIYDRTNNNFHPINKLNKESTVISGILKDNSNNIWLSTNSGLTKIDTLNNITNFEENNSIYPFTGGQAYIDHSGNILMAGNYGLSYFKPEALKPFDTNFKINFTSATLINTNSKTEIPSNTLATYTNTTENTLKIDPDNILFTIKYACSDPVINEEINYAYKIKELDNEWHHIGRQQSISFSNLRPGKYTLTLKGANKNMTWGQHNAILKIEVLPSIWETLWFKIIISITTLFLIIFIYSWRVSSIKSQKEKLKILLERKAQEVKEQQNKISQNKIEILQIEKQHQDLKQKKLKDELKFKTKELTNNTLRAVHKNELLNNIKENLKKEVKHKDINKENLKKIISHIDDSFMLDKEWDHFYSLFNQIHPSFIEKLKTKNPKLNDRDIKLCALILTGFTSQNMATLFGISLSSVKVARHRLRKKLNLEETASISGFLKDL